MTSYNAKVVLYSKSGYRPEMDALIEGFIRDQVKFIGVVGQDCEKIEEIIDEIVVGNGNSAHFILTSSHPGESLEVAVAFARALTLDYTGDVEIVEF